MAADMFKNQLQELAQRSCFNLPSYACIREGPDHAPRFKASVNFNGEIFESPSYCTTLRQAEHAAAEVALNVLSTRGPSRSLTARVLDETGVYKNLLQETAHRAGLKLPVYTTIRSGPGHVPVFTCTVELAAMNFTGEPAKTKKQAEKNAAIAAWSALKRMPNLDSLTNKETDQDQDQAIVARVLSNFRSKDDNNRNNNARRRDQNQAAARGRMVRGYRDSSTVSTASSSSSGTNSLLQYQQQWRLLDLLMDSVSLEGSNQQNSFVSLLPPPPPRTTSKILPPPSQSSNRHIPIQVRVNHNNNSQLKVQEFPGLLEEHQRDEEEWLGKKPESSSSCSVYGNHKQFPQANNNRLFGSVNHPMYTGGSLFNPQRMAPAVQIRSVIPVCAAPPMKEASSSPSTSSMSTQKGAEEVSKFNNNNNPTHSSYNYEEKRQ